MLLRPLKGMALFTKILTHLEQEADAADGNFVAANKPSLQIVGLQHLGLCFLTDDVARASISRYEVSVTSTETGEAIDGYCLMRIKMSSGLKELPGRR